MRMLLAGVLFASTAYADATPPAAAGNEAVAVARAWLNALAADGDMPKLAARTSLPFRLDWEISHCLSNSRDAAELAKLVACATKESFAGTVKYESTPLPLEIVKAKKLKKPLRVKLKPQDAAATLVHGRVDGDGETFDFVLLLRRADAGAPLRVSGLLIDSDVFE